MAGRPILGSGLPGSLAWGHMSYGDLGPGVQGRQCFGV
jgi:hypothetical protein